ncbi:hypothetical protein COO91_01990 [Nostoc flagelliforme CCNUN1]|uniref:Uncharacterized protein n=1 Tax=Nostoc flagelliforme CCNUN1 TaxID=2038116 RepID=A0A2K8SKX8_9NOSO|nr:hypothetical protein COO91_01990 [Nostoc flagelliforme CCNUN1]
MLVLLRSISTLNCGFKWLVTTVGAIAAEAGSDGVSCTGSI